ncbi:MAG: caspase family protein [Armatimonadetes bacterium]|nr:caspase family protein [Armatimonadota bacterium]
MRRMLCLLLLATAATADTYVVAVGVDTYDNEGISSLHYAVADVRAIADTFRASGLRDRNIAVLTSDAADWNQRATKGNVLRALGFAKECAVAGDTLIFFFSGHGQQVGDTSYLLTQDTDRDLVADTALPVSMLNTKLAGLQASRLLFVIDACRNDPNAGRSDPDAVLSDGMARGVRPVCLPGAGKPAPAAALLLACDVGQRAWEMRAELHGAFSWYLIRGLQGEAKDADGVVRLARLAGYVQEQVADWAQRAGHQQRPRFEAAAEDMDLLRVPARPVRIEEIPLVATLRVTTRPPGATVKLDGQEVGTTPLTLPVPLAAGQARKARVEVELPGHLPRAANVELVAGGTQEWSNVVLEKLPAASRPGRLLYSRWTAPWGTSSDLRSIRPDGTGDRLLAHDGQSGSWHPDGTWVAYNHTVTGDFEVFRVGADGSANQQLTNSPNGQNFTPLISPDGRRMLYNSSRNDYNTGYDLYVREIATGAEHLLWPGTGATSPGGRWAANSHEIYFIGPAKHDIMVIDADAANPTPHLLVALPQFGSVSAPAIGADGRLLTMAREGSISAPLGLYQLNADGSGVTCLVSGPDLKAAVASVGGPASAERIVSAVWSPDQRQTAFTYGKDGTFVLYVAEIGDIAQTLHQITTGVVVDWCANAQ